MPRPTGGRGYKGVGTTHIRVPLPIEQQVRKLVNEFYEGGNTQEPVNEFPSLDEAISIAENVLSAKKSARVSVSKLLEAIYGQKLELNPPN